jgi:clan AA aspartic protease
MTQNISLGDRMGEVRVKVKLANSFDEELVRRGQLALADVRTYEAEALVDTGSVTTVIPVHVKHALGLLSRGQRFARYADGRREVVDVTGPVTVSIYGRDAIDEALVLGDEILIGQTALEKMDLHVDCNNRRLIPNPAHPDQPVIRV